MSTFEFLKRYLNEINKVEEEERDFALEHHLNEALNQIAQLAALKEENERLKNAAKNLYAAAYWVADRPCDDSGLWKEMRDAAAIEPGNSTPQPAGGELISMSMCASSSGFWKAKFARTAIEVSDLKARVADLEGCIKQVIEKYDAACTAQGIEAYANALGAFTTSVIALREPVNES